MATISTHDSVLLARPTGGVLATDCFCSPCIMHDQPDASLAITGECLDNPWSQSGLIQEHPDGLVWCEAWEGST